MISESVIILYMKNMNIQCYKYMKISVSSELKKELLTFYNFLSFGYSYVSFRFNKIGIHFSRIQDILKKLIQNENDKIFFTKYYIEMLNYYQTKSKVFIIILREQYCKLFDEKENGSVLLHPKWNTNQIKECPHQVYDVIYEKLELDNFFYEVIPFNNVCHCFNVQKSKYANCENFFVSFKKQTSETGMYLLKRHVLPKYSPT